MAEMKCICGGGYATLQGPHRKQEREKEREEERGNERGKESVECVRKREKCRLKLWRSARVRRAESRRATKACADAAVGAVIEHYPGKAFATVALSLSLCQIS